MKGGQKQPSQLLSPEKSPLSAGNATFSKRKSNFKLSSFALHHSISFTDFKTEDWWNKRQSCPWVLWRHVGWWGGTNLGSSFLVGAVPATLLYLCWTTHRPVWRGLHLLLPQETGLLGVKRCDVIQGPQPGTGLIGRMGNGSSDDAILPLAHQPSHQAAQQQHGQHQLTQFNGHLPHTF